MATGCHRRGQISHDVQHTVCDVTMLSYVYVRSLPCDTDDPNISIVCIVLIVIIFRVHIFNVENAL